MRTGRARCGKAMLAVGVAALALSVGCSDDAASDDGSSGAGASGAGAGGTGATGATGGAGASGMMAGGTGAVGGEPAGMGGMAGSEPGTGSLMDVDLTLGGFNQDLPAPAMDCLGVDASVGCLSVSGQYNGADFAFSCLDSNPLLSSGVISMTQGRFLACDGDLSGSTVTVTISVSEMLALNPPSSYQVQMPEGSTFGNVAHRDRGMLAYNSDGEYRLTDSHEQQFALAGLTSLVPGGAGMSEQMEGTFAVSYTPLAGCSPDGDGFGCDSVRVRGVFRGKPILNVQP